MKGWRGPKAKAPPPFRNAAKAAPPPPSTPQPANAVEPPGPPEQQQQQPNPGPAAPGPVPMAAGPVAKPAPARNPIPGPHGKYYGASGARSGLRVTDGRTWHRSHGNSRSKLPPCDWWCAKLLRRGWKLGQKGGQGLQDAEPMVIRIRIATLCHWPCDFGLDYLNGFSIIFRGDWLSLSLYIYIILPKSLSSSCFYIQNCIFGVYGIPGKNHIANCFSVTSKNHQLTPRSARSNNGDAQRMTVNRISWDAQWGSGPKINSFFWSDVPFPLQQVVWFWCDNLLPKSST
jgi:hypothetical protein